MPLEQPGKYRAGLSLQELSAMMHNSDLGQMQPNVSGAKKKKGKKAPALTQLLSFSFFFSINTAAENATERHYFRVWPVG